MKIKYLVVLVIPFFISCKGGKKIDDDSIKSLPAFKVEEVDTVVSNKFVADIQARKNIEIHSRIAGLLEEIYVNEGQRVKKGQLLFKLSDAELQIELLKSEATLKTATANLRMNNVKLKQAHALYDRQVIADNELELAQAEYDAAEARVAFAQAEKNSILQQINFTSITAPFDGIIDQIPLKEGSLIQVGFLLTTVSELNEVYAYFSIPENSYFQMMTEGKMGKQDAISLILPNGIKYQYSGVLETADGEIDKQTGSIQFKARFENPEGLIKHGTSGKLIISEAKKNALIIPQKSVFSIQDKQFVFVIDKGNIVRMRTIITDGFLDDSYIIESGLKKGDLIVKEGIQSLRDGEKIQIKKVINF